MHYRASFTKQGKLAREHNTKKAPMGGEISVGDLLTMPQIKRTQTQHLIYISTNTI